MSRAATSIPDEWEQLLAVRVSSLRRPSLSHHIALLLEDDLRASGLLKTEAPDAEGDVLGKLQAELEGMRPKERAAFLERLEVFLASSRRAARGGKAA